MALKSLKLLQSSIYRNGHNGHQLSKVEACSGRDGVDSIAFCAQKMVSSEPAIDLTVDLPNTIT
ncbi:MAG TPA: hypothetical protein VE954_24115 [Oligoflexus sp.]|nr:hypothetical protein [Oligoflexus sp.]